MLFNKAIKWIVFSNIWVAINVASFYLFSAIHLDLEVDYRYLALTFFAPLFAYNYQRLLKDEVARTSIAHSERHDWIGEHQLLIKLFTILGAIGSTSIGVWVLPWWLLLMSVPAVIIVMFYARRRENLIALRNIPFFKVVLISVVWVFVVFIIPMLLENRSVKLEELIFGIQLFIFVGVMCIPFDIRDRKMDLGKVKTLPVALGVVKSKWVAIILFMLVVISSLFNSVYAFACISIIVIPSLLLTSEDRKELFFTGWIDGQFVLLLLLQLFLEVI